MRVLQNYVGGQWIDSTSRNLRQSFNPANHEELLCKTQDSNPADAAAAIQAAENAFARWARTPMPKRAALLQDFLSHFKSREEEFVRAITRENGKTLRESRTEFLAALKEADFQVGQGRRVAGELRPWPPTRGVAGWWFATPSGG
jgi:acyl-CoA reductase-like NAD-dependent aldehyde dehydrogenase